jgi:hypothetical protein
MAEYDYEWLKNWIRCPKNAPKISIQELRKGIAPNALEDDWILLKKWFNANNGILTKDYFHLPYEIALRISGHLRTFTKSTARLGHAIAYKNMVDLNNSGNSIEYVLLSSPIWMIANDNFSPLETAGNYYEVLGNVLTQYRRNNFSGQEFVKAVITFVHIFHSPIQNAVMPLLTIAGLLEKRLDASGKESVYVDPAPGNSEFHEWAEQLFEYKFRIIKPTSIDDTQKEMYKTLFNTYEKIETIGEGGSGEVYKVKADNGNIFALKVLNKTIHFSEKKSRFKNELYFCLKSNCPSIISVIDYGSISLGNFDSIFYVMKYYEKSLRKVMGTLKNPEDILNIYKRILDGVSYAHEKVTCPPKTSPPEWV